jgi:aldehyde dehydrogenase (NAD+)
LRTQAFINNEYVNAVSGKTFDTFNPSTEERIASVAECDKADVDIAVKAARAAMEGSWSKIDGVQRGKLMHKLADLCEKHFEELCTIEVMDNGKPISMYQAADMPLIISHLRYYAGWADKITVSLVWCAHVSVLTLSVREIHSMYLGNSCTPAKNPSEWLVK